MRRDSRRAQFVHVLLVAVVAGAGHVEASPPQESLPPSAAAGPRFAPGSTGPITSSAIREARRRADLAPPAAASARARQQPPRQVNWIGRHPALFGAVLGFGGGCALGASRVGGSEDHFFNALDEFACPVAGGIGAGIGAVVGWVAARVR